MRTTAARSRSLPHRRRMGHAHEQTFRSEQPRDDLAPGFLSHRNQELEALRLQLRGGLLDVPYVEFDPRLWHGNLARPLIGAKARLSRLCQRPQGKVLHAGELARMQIAVAVL